MSLIEDKVNLVYTKDIDFDTQNPRGETEHEIISDDSFDKLKHSINIYGVLEPLVIKSKADKITEYILIDGERRLRAAKELKKEKVPAVTAKDETDGLKLAYQIHMHRKPWTKIAEIKAIERIIQSIKDNDPNISETNLRKEIKDITNHSKSTINEFFIILKYEDFIIEKVKSTDLNYSYLIRIEEDFMNPLKRSFENIISQIGENNIRNSLVKKAELGLLINTRFMMHSDFKIIFQTPLLKGQIGALITEFITTDIETTADLLISVKELIENNRELLSSETIEDANISKRENEGKDECPEENKNSSACEAESKSVISKPIKGKKQNQTSILDIKTKIENIGETFTTEEREYLEEALDCLATKSCLKASVLMIWASGISKILNFIGKDIAKFNLSCSSMKSAPKSFYKYFAPSFQMNVQSLDEVREASKDMQLLCFLGYQNIITHSDFKKLKAHYDTRNDCAHPTSIKLTMSEVIVIFENVNKLILDNDKLK
jgi:ParB/RepB/Spo0J family partition protein